MEPAIMSDSISYPKLPRDLMALCQVSSVWLVAASGLGARF